MTEQHHSICEWHLDQYNWECTCGLTAPKATWFDAAAQEYEERNKSMSELDRATMSDLAHREWESLRADNEILRAQNKQLRKTLREVQQAVSTLTAWVPHSEV